MRRRSRRGVQAVETALVVPIVLVLVFGMIDVSWLLAHVIGIDGAAGQSVRLLGGIADAPTARAVAREAVLEQLGLIGVPIAEDEVSVVVEVSGEDAPVLTLRVGVDYKPLIGWVIGPRELELRASTPYYGAMYLADGDTPF